MLSNINKKLIRIPVSPHADHFAIAYQIQQIFAMKVWDSDSYLHQTPV